MNTDAKILKKTIANRTQKYFRDSIHHGKMKLLPVAQGRFNICKSITVINHIKMKDNKLYDHLDTQKNSSIYDKKGKGFYTVKETVDIIKKQPAE